MNHNWIRIPIIHIISLIFLTYTYAHAQGIQFFEGSWDEALEASRTQRKLIFVDAYTTWCGPCKMMDRNTYPKASVGEFYNKHFINVKMDMERGEGFAFGQRYNVQSYPTLLFINHIGKQVYRDSAYKSPYQMLELGSKALNPERNLALLALEFESGEGDPEKIREYALMLHSMGKDYREPAAAYFATLSSKDLLTTQNWQTMLKLTNDISSREFAYLLQKRKKFSRKFGDNAVEDKIKDVLKQSVASAAIFQNREKYSQALAIALKSLDDNGQTAQRLRMTYAAGTRNWKDYAFKATDYFEKYTITDAEALTQAAQYFLQYIPAEERLEQALAWIQQANTLAPSFERKFIQASILYKLERWDEAMKSAYQSLNTAEQGIGTEDQIKEAQELIDRIYTAKN